MRSPANPSDQKTAKILPINSFSTEIDSKTVSEITKITGTNSLAAGLRKIFKTISKVNACLKSGGRICFIKEGEDDG